MKNKIIIALFCLVALAVLFSGCTQQNAAACGNAACDSGETFQNCPADCPEGEIPMPGNTEGTGQPPELPF
ncbi:MAG: hypothetical protein PHD95_02620 [Candidatus ainarchaeum sp.]|nr:hypothetical protein [Candidatus ainarchaeum sp.]